MDSDYSSIAHYLYYHKQTNSVSSFAVNEMTFRKVLDTKYSDNTY